jgi:hypothetical protein
VATSIGDDLAATAGIDAVPKERLSDAERKPALTAPYPTGIIHLWRSSLSPYWIAWIAS